MIRKERCSNGRLLGLWMHREQILGMMVAWECPGQQQGQGVDLVLAEGKEGLDTRGRREPAAGT